MYVCLRGARGREVGGVLACPKPRPRPVLSGELEGLDSEPLEPAALAEPKQSQSEPGQQQQQLVKWSEDRVAEKGRPSEEGAKAVATRCACV